MNALKDILASLILAAGIGATVAVAYLREEQIERQQTVHIVRNQQ